MISRLCKSESKRVHPELDFNAVSELFQSQQSKRRLGGEQVTSPFDLYSVEHVRDLYSVRVEPSVATDVFVMAAGEPSDRSLTKIGGLPCWPADRDWPHTEDGLPFRFLAQFNFQDSTDLVRDLPGVVLTFLTADSVDWPSDLPHLLRCVWQDVTDEQLISLEEWQSLAATDTPEWFGVIHRTADYPAAWRSDADVPSVYDRLCERDVRQPYCIPSVQGTKIGGAPAWIQGDAEINGTFLCQLASVQAAPEVPYPWVNREQPLGLSRPNSIYADDQTLVFHDMGCLYAFIDSDRELILEFQSY